jgi:hypothetical protein
VDSSDGRGIVFKCKHCRECFHSFDDLVTHNDDAHDDDDAAMRDDSSSCDEENDEEDTGDKEDAEEHAAPPPLSKRSPAPVASSSHKKAAPRGRKKPRTRGKGKAKKNSRIRTPAQFEKLFSTEFPWALPTEHQQTVKPRGKMGRACKEARKAAEEKRLAERSEDAGDDGDDDPELETPGSVSWFVTCKVCLIETFRLPLMNQCRSMR